MLTLFSSWVNALKRQPRGQIQWSRSSAAVQTLPKEHKAGRACRVSARCREHEIRPGQGVASRAQSRGTTSAWLREPERSLGQEHPLGSTAPQGRPACFIRRGWALASWAQEQGKKGSPSLTEAAMRLESKEWVTGGTLS